MFRISTLNEAGIGLTFNQFLVVDEQPVLIETGFNHMFGAVRAQIAKVIDPASLRYIVVPHFEGDECGSLNQFLALAPQAKPVCSRIAAGTSLADYATVEPFTIEDGQVIPIGTKRLRFLLVPFCHAWESLIVYEETEKLLFSSDLFMQKGQSEAVTSEDRSANMLEVYRTYNAMPPGKFLLQAAEQIEKLDLKMVIPMHGSAIKQNFAPYITALKEFAQKG